MSQKHWSVCGKATGGGSATTNEECTKQCVEMQETQQKTVCKIWKISKCDTEWHSRFERRFQTKKKKKRSEAKNCGSKWHINSRAMIATQTLRNSKCSVTSKQTLVDLYFCVLLLVLLFLFIYHIRGVFVVRHDDNVHATADIALMFSCFWNIVVIVVAGDVMVGYDFDLSHRYCY